MRAFHIIGILTTLAALFALVNYHLLRLPSTVGLMLQSLLLSIGLLLLQLLGVDLIHPAQHLFTRVNFNVLLLEGLLSFLLFAGALFAKNEELLDVKFDIAVFATAGVIISTAIIGGGLYLASELAGLRLRPIYCFLFGALISPTDPVSVLPTLRSLGIPDRMNAQIAGESLFNDGIGIVLFLSLITMASGTGQTGPQDVLLLFVREAAGGLAFGAALGWIGYLLIKSVDNYQLEILITLALVSGGYSLATVLGISGPLSMVVTGLLIGGPGRRHAMSDKTRDNLDRFWELVEEMLNAILFTLIGLEVLALISQFSMIQAVTGIVAVPLVLVARYVSVTAIVLSLRCCGEMIHGTIPVMTWSGLRGGIPIALAISLPDSPERGSLLFATYVVVAFSILIQGTTLKYLVERRYGE